MTDQTPLWAYALGCVGFTLAFLALPLLILAVCKWVERQVDQRINLHIHRALHPNVTVLDQKRAVR